MEINNKNVQAWEGDDIEIISFSHKNGKIEVIKRKPSNHVWMTMPPQKKPDKIMKFIYVSSTEGIVLEKIIEGKHYPARQVEESIHFSK